MSMRASSRYVAAVERPAGSLRERAARYSTAQQRTIAAALELFADNGVGGTSLQMIADSVGVTKAAIYHQFKTKDSIMVAVSEVEMAHLEAALEAAETEGTSPAVRESLLSSVIDAAVERRRAVSTLQNDPVLVRLLTEHQPFARLWSRIFAVLLGGEQGPSGRVRAAALSAAIGGAVSHPLVRDLDDDTLRAELVSVTRRLLDER
jgi:AcrR family transcriptional regulator